LGVDLGSRRVGVALSNSSRTVATPLTVIQRAKRRSDDHEAVRALVEEWEIGVVVVGLPLSLDGSLGPAAKKAKREAKELGVVTGVPVETYDERLTTVSAHQALREQGVAGHNRRDMVDMVAAAVLLQAWLDTQANAASGHPDPSAS
jgi:putative Holliday junction resolvase